MNRNAQRILDELFEGVGKPTRSGLIVGDVEVAYFLIRHAEAISKARCVYGPDCEVCNAEHAIWWDWCVSLSGPVRVRMQRIMRAALIPLPPGPWEEVPTNAVPTTLY